MVEKDMSALLIDFILDIIDLFTKVSYCCLELKDASINTSNLPLALSCHKFNDLRSCQSAGNT